MIKLTIDITSDDYQFHPLHGAEHRFTQLPREGDYLLFPEGCVRVKSVVFEQDGVCFEPRFVRVITIPEDRRPKPRMDNLHRPAPLMRAEPIHPGSSQMHAVPANQTNFHVTEVMP